LGCVDWFLVSHDSVNAFVESIQEIFPEFVQTKTMKAGLNRRTMLIRSYQKHALPHENKFFRNNPKKFPDMYPEKYCPHKEIKFGHWSGSAMTFSVFTTDHNPKLIIIKCMKVVSKKNRTSYIMIEAFSDNIDMKNVMMIFSLKSKNKIYNSNHRWRCLKAFSTDLRGEYEYVLKIHSIYYDKDLPEPKPEHTIAQNRNFEVEHDLDEY
jgi:hypothetical protein